MDFAYTFMQFIYTWVFGLLNSIINRWVAFADSLASSFG